MPQRTLRLRIRQDGFVEESVEGVIGGSCHEVTKRIENELGNVERCVPTSEAFQTTDQKSSIITLEQTL